MIDICLVACVEHRLGLGLAGRIPWDCPADRRRFARLTAGGVVVVGRVTAEGLPALPGREVWCLGNSAPAGCVWHHSVADVLAAAALRKLTRLWVAGGQATYAAFLPHATSLELTVLDAGYDCDRRFPPVLPGAFTVERGVRFGEGRFVSARRVAKTGTPTRWLLSEPCQNVREVACG